MDKYYGYYNSNDNVGLVIHYNSKDNNIIDRKQYNIYMYNKLKHPNNELVNNIDNFRTKDLLENNKLIKIYLVRDKINKSKLNGNIYRNAI